jgi:type IV pilus assembly protein PilM
LVGFYQSSSNSSISADDIFISGGGALLGNLQNIFQNELHLTVHLHDPFRRVSVDEGMFQKEYLEDIAPQMVVPFGLSLRAI